jgi:hypothetical protein
MLEASKRKKTGENSGKKCPELRVPVMVDPVARKQAQYKNGAKIKTASFKNEITGQRP